MAGISLWILVFVLFCFCLGMVWFLKLTLWSPKHLTVEQQNGFLYLLHQVLVDLQTLASKGQAKEAFFLTDIFENVPYYLCEKEPRWPRCLSSPIDKSYWRTTDYPSRVRLIKRRDLSTYPTIIQNKQEIPTEQYHALLYFLQDLLCEIRYWSGVEQLEPVEPLAKIFQDLPLQMLMGQVNWNFYFESLPSLQQRYKLLEDYSARMRLAQQGLRR